MGSRHGKLRPNSWDSEKLPAATGISWDVIDAWKRLITSFLGNNVFLYLRIQWRLIFAILSDDVLDYDFEVDYFIYFIFTLVFF